MKTGLVGWKYSRSVVATLSLALQVAPVRLVEPLCTGLCLSVYSWMREAATTMSSKEPSDSSSDELLRN
jgi:hypothetical protein